MAGYTDPRTGWKHCDSCTPCGTIIDSGGAPVLEGAVSAALPPPGLPTAYNGQPALSLHTESACAPGASQCVMPQPGGGVGCGCGACLAGYHCEAPQPIGRTSCHCPSCAPGANPPPMPPTASGREPYYPCSFSADEWAAGVDDPNCYPTYWEGPAWQTEPPTGYSGEKGQKGPPDTKLYVPKHDEDAHIHNIDRLELPHFEYGWSDHWKRPSFAAKRGLNVGDRWYRFGWRSGKPQIDAVGYPLGYGPVQELNAKLIVPGMGAYPVVYRYSLAEHVGGKWDAGAEGYWERIGYWWPSASTDLLGSGTHYFKWEHRPGGFVGGGWKRKMASVSFGDAGPPPGFLSAIAAYASTVLGLDTSATTNDLSSWQKWFVPAFDSMFLRLDDTPELHEVNAAYPPRDVDPAMDPGLLLAMAPSPLPRTLVANVNLPLTYNAGPCGVCPGYMSVASEDLGLVNLGGLGWGQQPQGGVWFKQKSKSTEVEPSGETTETVVDEDGNVMVTDKDAAGDITGQTWNGQPVPPGTDADHLRFCQDHPADKSCRTAGQIPWTTIGLVGAGLAALMLFRR